MKRVVIVLALCLAFVTSCSPVKQLNIEKIGLSEFRMESSTKANIVFDFSLENMASFPIELVLVDATIKKDVDLFATVELKSAVLVPAQTKDVVKVPVEVNLCDPMSLLSMGLNVRNWDINEFIVSGKIVLKGKNGAKATHKIKEMPLSTLLNRIRN